MRTTSLHPRGGTAENTGRQVGLIHLTEGVRHGGLSSPAVQAIVSKDTAALAADMAASTIVRIGVITPRIVNNLYNMALRTKMDRWKKASEDPHDSLSWGQFLEGCDRFPVIGIMERIGESTEMDSYIAHRERQKFQGIKSVGITTPKNT